MVQNLVGGSWDPLGPPVVGASGPIARDISTIYESTLENRKQVGSSPRFCCTFALSPALPLARGSSFRCFFTERRDTAG
eukprot:624374-Rhodomonas_salina.1